MIEEQRSPQWPAAWLRAALGTAVLTTLENGPLHGYGIAAALEERGFGRPKGGSLYPLLTAMEEDGVLSAVWEQGESGPGRRTYSLTAAGHERLDTERGDWRRLVQALDQQQTAIAERGSR